jgi:hypothetical protein
MYSPEVLPATPEEQAALKRALSAQRRDATRIAEVARHITITQHP